MTRDSRQYRVVPPGSTIGILGSGQLGRMMTMAAKTMGYRVHVFSSSPDSPCGQVADMEVVGELDDLGAIEAFAKRVDVVTVETENIPTPTFQAARKFAAAFPGESALRVCQNRKLEKQFLAQHGIPTCNFRIVRSADELRLACDEIMPGILKTTTGGYDGKGQASIDSNQDFEEAWNALGAPEAILEERINFDFEFSVVGIRHTNGTVAAYPSIRNEHKNGILDVSFSPSGLSDGVNRDATEAVYQIMNQLESVGVLTVEFFYRDGDFLVNEMAPRPHNSGHLTIEGHVTNQFEQHVRSVCGLPLGSTESHRPSAMANILGCLWSGGQPNWQQAIAQPNTKLHLYGKTGPQPERKMGHLTSIDETVEKAFQNVLNARRAAGIFG